MTSTRSLWNQKESQELSTVWEELKYSWGHWGQLLQCHNLPWSYPFFAPISGTNNTYTCTHMCTCICKYITDVGTWTALSKPWSQRYGQNWAIGRKEDMVVACWPRDDVDQLWFSCSDNCSFHTDRGGKGGGWNDAQHWAVPRFSLDLLLLWFSSNVSLLWSQSCWHYWSNLDVA